MAARAHNATFATLLLARGAEANAQDQAGDTPLHLVVRGLNQLVPQSPVIPLLVSHRADLGKLNAGGESPLRLDLMRPFYVSPLFLPPGATNHLFAAARAGDLKSPEAYLQLDPSLATIINPQSRVSPLRFAAEAGQAAVAERLRQAGASDPLSAALLGWTNSLAAFLTAQPDLGATRPGGLPLLHVAASRGQLAAVRLLLTPELSPNVTDFLDRKSVV